MRRLPAVLLFTALAASAAVGAAPTAAAAPPPPPDAATPRSHLASLTVAAEGPSTGYSRDKFPHWITQSGTCNTREVVLQRDGSGVVTDSSCAAVSGTWRSPYDSAT
ncbi:hypothetical protein GCM10009678_82850 [Actinomadura kijaniata]|uniref:Spy/CpxP family protein refolding chaperone n=1 Tax=Actinomadura namibiensis TaxID=182080 RepID=A0A7W3M077_ACTNM|nr:hypothetical protein [Actinomadura namibiensis]MBA8957457.1 Spy/CpxP family protein refolding chaperone [Actinomadura namibiensis]